MSKRKEFYACILLNRIVNEPVDPSGPAYCELKCLRISLIGVGMLLCEDSLLISIIKIKVSK